jgi:hypothetical protein
MADQALALAPAVHPRARCRFCGRWRNPNDFILPSALQISPCFDCYRANEEALEVFANQRQPGCWECRKTIGELNRLRPETDGRMCLHRKDGLLQLLCFDCSNKYERQRLDLYGDTPYGERKKLKGAK